jgi:eukaryotic-like serine/threonine-protein kinase
MSVIRGDELAATLRAPAEHDELFAGVVAGEWVIEGRQNRGGFASIYRARRLEDDRRFALKVLHRDRGNGTAALRFQREAAILHRLRHPNIVELHATGTLPSGRPYLALEWVDGYDLSQELLYRGVFTLIELLELMEQLVAALATMHDGGFIHRDLKLQNVMVPHRGRDARVTLLDFGVAKPLRQDAVGHITLEGEMVGTPLTMAPEQLLGTAVDARTDVYGLGLMVYQLLTGRLAFRGASLTDVRRCHLFASVPSVTRYAAVTPALDEIVRRCVEKQMDDRFPDVGAFLDALRAAIG